MPMAKGLSLHIGLNSVDPSHYQGWSGPLTACEADAKDMNALATTNKFKATLLLTKKATRNAVLAGIAKAAKTLGSGDIFFLTYSGHGGQLPDLNHDEDDGLDETWCLYDGELVDDEIFMALDAFKTGVRVLVLSDSCHSGSVLRDALLASSLASDSTVTYRAMPPEVAQRTYLGNQKFYDKLLKNKKSAKAMDNVKAAATLISGCQDNQLSADGAFNGRFTGVLKTVWNGGKFSGNYAQFHQAILRKVPPDQTPNLFKGGAANAAFDAQKPFTI